MDVKGNQWKIYFNNKEVNVQPIPESFKEVIELGSIVEYWSRRNKMKEKS